MNNKKIVAITSIIIFLIILFYIFYLYFIKPVIVGEYIPKISECSNAYNCVCLQNTCTCSYKKWFWENKMVCERDKIRDMQIENK